VAVRHARPGDADAVARIYAHWVATSAATFDEVAPSAAETAAKIDATRAAGLPFLVAETGGRVEGHGALSTYRPRPAYRFTVEDSVYVDPSARGRGHGRALLERLLEEARRAGLREVVAVVAVTEDAASVALHRACGFREVGRLERVGCKFGRWHDTLLLQRSLAPPPGP
jgi:phosphinothricin acetyltransferase